jgi:pimeloyl-ACP methyl ester carboxylesterase
MKAVFDDPQFSFQMLRALSGAIYGASDIGECLSTAYRITEGDFESWYTEWNSTAERIHGLAEESLRAGHRTSAREAFMRASNYYRLAEFYLHGDPGDPRINILSKKSSECFDKSLELSEILLEPVKIPYEATVLPGHFYRVDSSGRTRPTLIAQTGFDGTIEELYAVAAGAVGRGLNCLTFEGPGQGSVIRDQGLVFRPDWENVVTPVVDFAFTLPEVDRERTALMGISFGGYLAPRAAAFEHRLAAVIANGGVYSFIESRVPEGMTLEQMLEFIRSDPDDFNKGAWKMAETNSEMRWGMQNGIFTFGADSPGDWWLKCADYTMEGLTDKITCPILVVDSEGDKSFPGEARKLYDALTGNKTWMQFTAEEGAEEHCQIGAGFLSGERIFNWLAETLGISG